MVNFGKSMIFVHLKNSIITLILKLKFDSLVEWTLWVHKMKETSRNFEKLKAAHVELEILAQQNELCRSQH